MKNLIDYFSANIGKSDAYTTMTNHIYQEVGGVRQYASNDVRFGGSVSIPRNDTKYRGNSVYDSLRVFDIITDVIKSGKLPDDPVHGLYGFIFEGSLFVYPGPTLGSWAQQWCGAHSQLPIPGLGNRLYHTHFIGDWITRNPFLAYPYSCGRKQFENGISPNNNKQADTLVKIFDHELIEHVSNYDRAWYWHFAGSINSGNENGDMCAEQQAPYLRDSTIANAIVGSKTWLLQSNWMPVLIL